MFSTFLSWELWLDYLAKLAIAIVLSGVGGLERQTRRKPAGLRTYMLVCLGALVFTLLGLDLLAREGAPLYGWTH